MMSHRAAASGVVGLGLALALWIAAVWFTGLAAMGGPVDRISPRRPSWRCRRVRHWSRVGSPESPFGWIIGVYGVLAGVDGATIGYGAWSGSVAAWLGTWTGLVAGSLVRLALLFLPDGHLPSKRWQQLVWLLAIATVAGGISVALMPSPLALLPANVNPLGLKVRAMCFNRSPAPRDRD